MADNTKIQWSDAKIKKAAYDQARYRRLQEEKRARRAPDLIEGLSETDCAYLAGLIDGEGSIFVMKHRDKTFYPAVSICMTHPGALSWMANALGLTASLVRRTPEGWRDQLSVRVHGKRAIRLCERILPHLKVKRLQAEMILSFPADERRAPGVLLDKEVNATRASLREQINALNSRGSGNG